MNPLFVIAATRFRQVFKKELELLVEGQIRLLARLSVGKPLYSVVSKNEGSEC